MPRGLHDYSVRVCLPAGLKVESPLSTDRLIPGLARISEGFKHCGDPVRGAGCIRKYRACHAVRCRVSVPVRGAGCITALVFAGPLVVAFQPPLGERVVST